MPQRCPDGNERQVIAVFDFDGTITRRDTLLPFLLSASNSYEFLRNMLLEMPTLSAFALRRIGNQIAKESLLKRFFKGEHISTLEQKGTRFAQQKVPQMLRSTAIDRLRWHQDQGHRCIIASASLDIYVYPWAKSAGIDDVLCSRLARDADNRVLGRLDGLNCFGQEKIRRLRSLLGDLSGIELFAYGDSDGDHALLREADHAFYRSFKE
jgi:HAD superfamily hydrolase (TIGR01490 family)